MGDVKEPVPDKSIVFGRLDLIKDGKPQSWSSFWKAREGRILILAPDSTKAMNYTIGKDGSFYWGLDPGEYIILAFELSEGGGVRGGRIGATFTVGEETENIYIGNLKILLMEGMYGFAMEDDYPTAVTSFKKRYPNAQEPVKQLVLLEPKVGSYGSIRGVCAEEWGIECTKHYLGVTPLKPSVGSQAFKKVDSLQPTFEWTPSSKSETHYDLVVYEAVSYTRSGMDTEFMPGRLVMYEEDLDEAVFSLNMPLRPDSKYYWSVRLRQDDVVSKWSSFSYFKFFIVGWSSGYGQWFSFSTPPE